MSDLISRQALRDAMYHEAFETDTEMQRWDSGCWIRYKLFENIIDNLPSAEKTGKWMQTETMNVFECSCCHSRWNIHYVSDFDYCPNCGANMEVKYEQATCN